MALGLTPFTVVITAVLAIGISAFLSAQERRVLSEGRIDFRSNAWITECAQWDSVQGSGFFVSLFDRGLGHVPVSVSDKPQISEAKVVVTSDPEFPDLSTLGFKLDPPRNRLVAALAQPILGKRSAVAAYDTTTWKRLFITELAGSERRSLADDVAIDDDGNIYVTDAIGGLIWKVKPDGSQPTVLPNSDKFKLKLKHILVASVTLNGIVYHPDGFLLVSHQSGDAIFKVSLDGHDVQKVDIDVGPLLGDGITLVTPNQLAVAGLWSGVRLVETKDAWSSANITHVYSSPKHRLASAVTVKDGDVFVSFLNGFGVPYMSTIAKADFKAISHHD